MKEYTVGKRVEARYKGRGNWYKGLITSVNSDGSIDVTYDDGEVDIGLNPKFVKVVREGLVLRLFSS